MGVVVLGGVLVAVLALANWGTVRDHVVAWRFLLTRKTETVEPHAEELLPDMVHNHIREIANALHCPVIFAAEEWRWWKLAPLPSGPNGLALLEEAGFRLLEQRLPRRAYVVTGYKPPVQTPEAPQRFMGASETIDLKAAPGTPRSPFSE